MNKLHELEKFQNGLQVKHSLLNMRKMNEERKPSSKSFRTTSNCPSLQANCTEVCPFAFRTLISIFCSSRISTISRFPFVLAIWRTVSPSASISEYLEPYESNNRRISGLLFSETQRRRGVSPPYKMSFFVGKYYLLRLSLISQLQAHRGSEHILYSHL